MKDKYGEIVKEKMSIFHFDEKWIFNKYISYYFNIEPSKDELIGFIEKISNKIENRLIITTGIETNELIDKIKIFFKNNNRVKVVNNLDFIDLEYLITHSNLLITCHGAVSHVASAKNIKIIDIIDKNPSNPYNKWTDHFRNYHPIYRKKFMSLSEEILKEINK